MITLKIPSILKKDLSLLQRQQMCCLEIHDWKMIYQQ